MGDFGKSLMISVLVCFLGYLGVDKLIQTCQPKLKSSTNQQKIKSLDPRWINYRRYYNYRVQAKYQKVIPQQEFKNLIKNAQKRQDGLCEHLFYENFKICEPKKIKAFVLFLNLMHNTNIEDPLKYNKDIKYFTEQTVKTINDDEEKIKAIYLKIKTNIKPCERITKTAIQSMRNYHNTGEFEGDCNVFTYFFGACVRSLGYEYYDVEVLENFYGKKYGKGPGHDCGLIKLNERYKLVDLSFLDETDPFFGYGIKHHKIKVKIPLDSIVDHYNEKPFSQEVVRVRNLLHNIL